MKTLLLAESHAPTLAHLEESLTLAGHGVRAVSDPVEALELFLAERPDVLVVAADLPPIESLHLAQQVRLRGGQVKVVVIDKGHLGKAKGLPAVLELHADAYVADPIKGSELSSKLAVLLAAPASLPKGGIARTLARPAVATGRLDAHPLPALLHSFFRLRRGGILLAVSGARVRRLFLREGGVVGFDSSVQEEGFVAFLVQRDLLTPAQAERTRASLGEGMRIGSALEDAGVLLEGDELLGQRRAFVRDRAAQVVSLREGRFAFYPGDEFLPEVLAVETPALAPILEGVRRTFPIRFFIRPLRPHLDQRPARTETFSPDLSALGLDTDDLKVAMQMDGRFALRDLLAHGRGDLRRTASLAWFLHLTQTLGFSTEPAAGSRGPEALLPRKLKPLPAETVHALREAALRVLASSYFGALGVPITAEDEQVERAYREVAPRFHADSYPENDTSELQDLLDSVQEKMTAAYRVLSQPAKRTGYLQHLLSRLDLPRSVEVNVEAELSLQRGEAALKRGDARSAAIAFEEAVSLSPREPEYHACLAWACYLGPGSAEERARAAQRPLRKALGLNPLLERAQVLSAVIDLDAGDLPSARKKLLKVLDLNPRSKIAKAALRKANR